MIRHDDDLVGGSATYVLYLEYLGGLVPILKGKRASKLKPEFVIFDPHSQQPPNSNDADKRPKSESSSRKSSKSNRRPSTAGSLYWTTSSGTSSESEYDDAISLPSPLMRRRCRRKRGKRSDPDDPITAATAAAANDNANQAAQAGAAGTNQAAAAAASFMKPESTYADEMPEAEKLVLINSNIWGTKFKILGLCGWLPSSLGTVTYRTSLLHLQPRQMTLQIKELGERRKTSMTDCEVTKSSSTFASSEDEDEQGPPVDEQFSAPVAPLTPKKNIRGHQSTISPERKPSLYLRATAHQHPLLHQNSAAASSYSEYDDLLTLQINNEHGGVTMEMTGPSITAPPTLPTAANISTQTSFQSVTELLNCLSNGYDKVAIASGNTPTSSTATDDLFSAMAKKFAT